MSSLKSYINSIIIKDYNVYKQMNSVEYLHITAPLCCMTQVSSDESHWSSWYNKKWSCYQG